MMRCRLCSPLRNELADLTEYLKRARKRKKIIHQTNKQKELLQRSKWKQQD
jgi:hypothetical protein